MRKLFVRFTSIHLNKLKFVLASNIFALYELKIHTIPLFETRAAKRKFWSWIQKSLPDLQLKKAKGFLAYKIESAL